jgi:fermentation-respiration switch protein FrsA (DUF1100 family)
MRAAVAALALLAAGCTQLFLHPGKMQAHHPDRLGLRYEDVWLAAPDGAKLHAWWLPAAGPALGTVLHLHGNAENISTFIKAVHWLPGAGYNVLLVDYRGYGRSEGTATIHTVHEDARLALDAALARPGPWFVFGQSLGGSAAIHAVAHHPQRARVAAVVSEGAYSSYRRIAREKMNQAWFTWALQWPLSFLFSDRYAAERSAAALAPVPLLVVHGERDEVVAPSHARRLFEAAREPRELWLVPGGGHVNAFTRVENRERLLAYLARRAAASP